jgi:hypothetical protein
MNNYYLNYFPNPFAVPCTSKQPFALREVGPLEVGTGEPCLSAWILRKQAEASDACFWSACSSMCSAAPTVSSEVISAEGSLTVPFSSDTTFHSARNPAYWPLREEVHADARSHYCDADRGWRECADIHSEGGQETRFEDACIAQGAMRPENFARRSCTFEPKRPGSIAVRRQQPVLEEYSLGSGNPYAFGER